MKNFLCSIFKGWNDPQDNIVPTDNGKSGFEPDETFKQPCRALGHDAPTHLYIPAGQKYVHKCPACGFTIILRGSHITF